MDYAIEHGTRPAARLFNISEGTIRSWKLRGFDKPSPLVSRGRKVTYGKDLDEELYLGLMAMISENQVITVDQFTDYSKRIIDERRPELNFKCSRGWIDKFLNRHNLAVVKSDVGKLMQIVERPPESENSKSEPGKSGMGILERQLEADNSIITETCLEVEPSMEVTVHDSTESAYVYNNSGHPSSEATFMMEPRNPTTTTENGTLAVMTSPKAGGRVGSGYNSYLKEQVSVNLSERDQRQQREAAKSLHVMDIMGKLDVITSSNTGNLDPQKRLEVIRHAKLHGSRSAERTYGVPETTVKFWLKKAPPSSNEQLVGKRVDGNRNVGMGMGNVGMASPVPVVGGDQFRSTTTTQSGIPAPVSIGGGDGMIEANILLWMMEKKRNGELVTFDGLCDQALTFVSQGNPGSAYSSTRKWVDQFLNLKLKDAFSVQM